MPPKSFTGNPSQPYQPIYPILLAAGRSSRLAPHLKQLLVLKSTGKTLIEHCIEAALAGSSLQKPLTVVLGAEATRIQQQLPQFNTENGCNFIINNAHKKGLSSSIACGARHLLKFLQHQDFAILLMLVDQFELDSQHLNKLVELHRSSISKNPITATEYGNKAIGPPVIFSSNYLKELENLQGEQGAKSIISRHQDQLQTFSNPQFKGSDIDTIEDVRNANNRVKNPDL